MKMDGLPCSYGVAYVNRVHPTNRAGLLRKQTQAGHPVVSLNSKTYVSEEFRGGMQQTQQKVSADITFKITRVWAPGC